MNLENVFYGFTKDGNRKLLWKKNKVEITSLGDVSRTMYYDLEKKVYIEPIKVDEKTLVSIVKIVGDYKRKSKRKVIKAYKADCNLSFDITGAFFGDIIRKTANEVLIPEVEKVLFARIADPECRVQSVYTGRLYPWVNRIEKGIGVKEVRPINKELFSKDVISKKKLLEADYRKLL